MYVCSKHLALVRGLEVPVNGRPVWCSWRMSNPLPVVRMYPKQRTNSKQLILERKPRGFQTCL